MTSVLVTPPPNASGWNNSAVSVTLTASDLRNGMTSDLPGWVDRVHYSLSGAQVAGEQIVNGSTASVDVSTPGVTTLSYWATDAAGNDEPVRTLTIRIEASGP